MATTKIKNLPSRPSFFIQMATFKWDGGEKVQKNPLNLKNTRCFRSMGKLVVLFIEMVAPYQALWDFWFFFSWFWYCAIAIEPVGWIIQAHCSKGTQTGIGYNQMLQSSASSVSCHDRFYRTWTRDCIRRVHNYLFVADIFECVRDNGDAHVDEVGRRHFEHLLAELLAILVDLLDSHRAHDSPLMALQRDQRNVLDLIFVFAQELLAGGQQHVLILSLDFDLSDASHRDRNTLARINAWAFHLQGHCVQRNPVCEQWMC